MARGLVILPLLALLGCRVSTGATGELVLAVNVDRVSINAGQVVNVQVTATNEGDATVTFFAPTCAPAIQVRDASGTLVGPEEGIPCSLPTLPPVALPPGGRITVRSAWRSRTGTEGATVAPGSYRLRAANFFVRGGSVVRHVEATVSVTG